MLGLSRLFMDPVQAKLHDPSAYKRPRPADEVRAEVRASFGSDSELLPLMLQEIDQIARGGAVTIRAAARHLEQLDAGLGGMFPTTTLPELTSSALLLHLLVQQADQLADGIQPGAAKMFAPVRGLE